MRFNIFFDNNNNFDKEHLLCYIVITSTQSSPRTINKQINEDNKKQALFEERSLIGFLSKPHLKYYLSRYDWLVTLRDQLSHLEHPSNSNRKSSLLSTIDLTLKSLSGSVLAPFAYVPTERCMDNEHINKRSVAWQTWTLHQSSNISRFSILKLEISLVYIDQLEL